MKTLIKLTLCTIFMSGGVVYGQLDLDGVPQKDIVHADDVIINGGSLCVGFDCVNGESFGFDTQRLKENNLRIHFEDTSNSASFPSNDWRIVINDSSNGGGNYFGIDDVSGGKSPFRLEAGAPSHSLYVDNGGKVGLGTNNPVVELHIPDGDTPTMRLEQNGTSGFTPQTWDVAGNETNFFIRDVTNGSTLPFRIRPGAPTSSIDVSAAGNVGIGTSSPSSKLDVIGSAEFHESTATKLTVEMQNLVAGGQDISLRQQNVHQSWLLQNRKNGNWRIRNETTKTNPLQIAYSDNDITAAGDITANGVLLTSDLRLKKDVQKFTEGLSIVNALNPISYKFNDASGFLSDRTYYSIGAQELQEVAPYLVHNFTLDANDDNPNAEQYLKVDFAAIPWVLVNAVKEQQVQLDEKDEEIEVLRNELEDLKTQVKEITEFLNERYNTQDLSINGDNTVLYQNYPNPHNGQTVIEYQVPENTQSAEIHVYGINGQLLSTVKISETGKGKVNLQSQDLPAGAYTYSLIVDGNIKDTKQMRIVK